MNNELDNKVGNSNIVDTGLTAMAKCNLYDVYWKGVLEPAYL